MTPEIKADLLKLLFALILGSAIGAEREYKSKAVGFRTVILITVGSCLITILSAIMGGEKDSARIAANIVTGIGFLGAGAIFREGAGVKGVTTAATIWTAAAMGMAVGIGQYELALLVCAIVLVVLLAFTWFQNVIDKSNSNKIYKITLVGHDASKRKELENIFVSCKVQTKCLNSAKIGNEMVLSYSIKGSQDEHEHLVSSFYESGLIDGFEC